MIRSHKFNNLMIQALADGKIVSMATMAEADLTGGVPGDKKEGGQAYKAACSSLTEIPKIHWKSRPYWPGRAFSAIFVRPPVEKKLAKHNYL